MKMRDFLTDLNSQLMDSPEGNRSEDRKPQTAGVFVRALLVAVYFISIPACAKPQNVYEWPATDSFDPQFKDALEALKSQRTTMGQYDSMVYFAWGVKESQIRRGQVNDPTPDVTPKTVREALEEEQLRMRMEDNARSARALKTYCRFQQDGDPHRMVQINRPFKYNGKLYDDPCEALSENGLPMD